MAIRWGTLREVDVLSTRYHCRAKTDRRPSGSSTLKNGQNHEGLIVQDLLKTRRVTSKGVFSSKRMTIFTSGARASHASAILRRAVFAIIRYIKATFNTIKNAMNEWVND